MTTLYGIKNCDTVKKARKWLDDNNISYQFHDFRDQGLSQELLTSFAQRQSWADLINKRSTTYRNLSDEVKSNLTEQVATEQVLAQPTLLKRPLLDRNGQLFLGFKAPQYQELFNND